MEGTEKGGGGEMVYIHSYKSRGSRLDPAMFSFFSESFSPEICESVSDLHAGSSYDTRSGYGSGFRWVFFFVCFVFMEMHTLTQMRQASHGCFVMLLCLLFRWVSPDIATPWKLVLEAPILFSPPSRHF